MHLRNRMKNLSKLSDGWLLMMILICLQACGPQKEINISEFYDLGPKGMLKDMEYVFSPELKDGKYEVLMALRYNLQCNLETLPLNMEYYSGDSDSVVSVLRTVTFPEAQGTHGKGSFGVYQIENMLLENFIAEEQSYITISTPATQTNGLISLGLIFIPKYKEDLSR